MLEVVHTVTHHKNFWRYAKMSELGELYISMTLKSFAFSMIGVFVPIYLYELGFSLPMIALYFVVYFAYRIPVNFLAGEFTARYGPKHTISYAYVITLMYLGLLLTMGRYNWPLWLLALSASISISFFFVAYHVDFSRIKEVKSVGSELSHMYMLQRVASAIGPLLGGLIATLFGVHIVIAISIVFVLLAIIPLMMTREPMRRRDSLNFNGISIKKEFRNIASFSATAIGRQLGLSIWPLYIAIFIFSENIYGLVGLVTSISVVASILMAKIIGNLIDNHRGGLLLRYSTFFLTIVHVSRAMITSLMGVIGTNILSEFGETGVLLPLMRGYYSRADSVKDRVAYVVMMESAIATTRALFWLFVMVLLMTLDAQTAFKVIFIVVALVTPLTVVQNFKTISIRKS